MHQAEWRVGLFWGQILWSLSGTKVEFLMKQKCSALNLDALLMLFKKSMCIYSHGVSEMSFPVFAPIRPNLKPAEASSKNPIDFNRPSARLTFPVPPHLWLPIWWIAMYAYMRQSAVVDTCISILCFSLSSSKEKRLELVQ